MATLRVGNAPCSWGTLEFEDVKGEQVPYSRMLDELVETGYTGTELGDWGYMPTDAKAGWRRHRLWMSAISRRDLLSARPMCGNCRRDIDRPIGRNPFANRRLQKAWVCASPPCRSCCSCSYSKSFS